MLCDRRLDLQRHPLILRATKSSFHDEQTIQRVHACAKSTQIDLVRIGEHVLIGRVVFDGTEEIEIAVARREQQMTFAREMRGVGLETT